MSKLTSVIGCRNRLGMGSLSHLHLFPPGKWKPHCFHRFSELQVRPLLLVPRSSWWTLVNPRIQCFETSLSVLCKMVIFMRKQPMSESHNDHGSFANRILGLKIGSISLKWPTIQTVNVSPKSSGLSVKHLWRPATTIWEEADLNAEKCCHLRNT